ncbi:MAG TPA: SLC13 family permease [Thermoanaerobaculia bacterium]|nr:SLC13 family permease [Thermoanaerobaculia bacterium]
MPLDVILLLVVVAVAVVLFVSGRVRMDLVGLLVLSILALSGLVTTEEALAGFSSPAVVTVWAMFILSAGLSRTGLAHRIGQPLLRFARRGEPLLVVVLMLGASLLSALINTVTVAVILLPATMELARRSGRSPSRLLMPLALGCLLGGPFTAISTPPNILVTDALRAAGLRPFALFDFTPITAAIVAAGILYMALIGRHLLPDRAGPAASDSNRELERSYELEEHLFTTRIGPGSPLAGRTLAESRLGSALHLTVVGIHRAAGLQLGPRADDVLRIGDTLILHGRPDHLRRLHGREHLHVESAQAVDRETRARLQAARARVGEGSPLVGATLEESGLRRQHRVHVLAVSGEDGAAEPARSLRRRPIAAGDDLLLQGERGALEALEGLGLVADLRPVEAGDLEALGGIGAQLLPVRVPPGSVLADRDLVESRLGNAFGLTVVGIVRGGELTPMPSPEEKVQAGDLLLLEGSPGDLEALRGLQELEISTQSTALAAELESQQVGVTEVLLSPRTRLAGRTLTDLLFRDRYGLTVLAIWRGGRPHRSGLQDLPLQFGDALLVYGHRRQLEGLARDPDFLVLDEAAVRAPRLEKAHAAAAILLAVLAAAMLGLVPIAIAALSGAVLMVLAGCVSMEEAYRAIDWKVVFLIAGMLPLGVAIENAGAAQLGSQALLATVGDLGPRWVVAALFVVTVLGTQLIPTAALVVLMAPVALGAADSLGVSPHLLMMTVAIAASSSFASPVSHPAHMLVMGPGGYRFGDYVRVGVPLTAVALLVSVALLPILWPP